MKTITIWQTKVEGWVTIEAATSAEAIVKALAYFGANTDKLKWTTSGETALVEG